MHGKNLNRFGLNGKNMIKNMMNLEGDLLVAMPNMTDPRFSKAVIYICAHTEDGAMGVVINKPVENVAFNELLEQIGFSSISPKDHIRVYFGGPVESARGFVLHSTDYIDDSTLVINKQFALTSTIDVIKALANGAGPSESILALGYAGWEAGQLDDEIL